MAVNNWVIFKREILIIGQPLKYSLKTLKDYLGNHPNLHSIYFSKKIEKNLPHHYGN